MAGSFAVVGFDYLIGEITAVAVGFGLVVLSVVWYLGRRLRERAERYEELRRERAADSDRAVQAERTRIARELHDVVAHRVSLMTVQVGAAKTVAVDDPHAALKAIDAARTHRPDVILMDIRMPIMDGLEATSRIVEEADWGVRVLILSTFDPDEYVYRALRAGASGFVLKDIPPAELVAAVRTVADGGALLAPSITKRLIGQFAERLTVDSALTARIERLTECEREVVTAIARGSSNAEIGEELLIGAATVKSHVSSILTKLGLRDRAQVVVFAYESGLVQAGDLEIGH